MNLKVIKNTLPNKSGNPGSLEKYKQQLEILLTIVHIDGDDLLRAFCNLSQLKFCISSDPRKTTVQQKRYQQCARHFLMKIIINTIPTKLAKSLFLCPFLSFRRNQKQESNFRQAAGLVIKQNLLFVYSESHFTSKRYRIQRLLFRIFFRC